MKPKGLNRRDFLGRLTAMAFVFNILPPATQYHRIWQALRPVVYPQEEFVRGDFAQYLIDQTPVFDRMILEEYYEQVENGPGWTDVETTPFDATQDRFREVFPPKLKDPHWERPLYFPTSEEVSAYA